MSQNAQNVSNAKPRAAGAIYRAPLIPAKDLPTDAVEKLSELLANLGYASDDGLTNSFDISNENFTAWGGDIVGSYRTSYEETFGLTLIETKEDVFKALHGDENVLVTESGLAIVHSSKDLDYGTWVFEVALSGNRVKRIVVPEGKITEREDVDHQDGELLGYGITISTRPVTLEIDGKTFTSVTAVEYIATIEDGSGDEPEDAEGE